MYDAHPSPRICHDKTSTSQLTTLPSGSDPSTLFDPLVPHSARVYNCWLGGKDHHRADRKVAEEVLAHLPQVAVGAQANRDFLIRAVEYLAAEAGVRQFLDIGTGLPAPGATHEVAQGIDPDSRVVYADNDALVLTHARALLTGTRPGTVGYVDADVRDPAGVLARASEVLDFSRPVGVLLLAVLHFIADANDPAGVVKELAGRLAPGSYVVISHLTADFTPNGVNAAVDAYNALMPVPVTARTHREITGLFGDLPLVSPGVVPVAGWRPRPFDAWPRPGDLYAGMAGTARGYW